MWPGTSAPSTEALPCPAVPGGGGQPGKRVGHIVRLVLRKILLPSALRNFSCLAGSSVALRDWKIFTSQVKRIQVWLVNGLLFSLLHKENYSVELVWAQIKKHNGKVTHISICQLESKNCLCATVTFVPLGFPYPCMKSEETPKQTELGGGKGLPLLMPWWHSTLDPDPAASPTACWDPWAGGNSCIIGKTGQAVATKRKWFTAMSVMVHYL